MIFPQLKKLKQNIEYTQHFIKRLEKDNELEKIPFYQAKLDKLQEGVSKMETLIKQSAV